MARTSNQNTFAADDLPVIDQKAKANLTELQNQFAELRKANSEDHALVHQLLGQAQMAGAFEDFSRTVRTSKLAYVKENKLYRALAGQKNPNGGELNGTWVEFCNLIGVSDEKANQDIANLKTFGEEALESMSRMGIGYRELRQYRRLPEDQKAALIEVAKTGDKESFVELAEEIIMKHAKEKAALEAERDEVKADYEAIEERLQNVTQSRDQALLDVEKIRRRIQTASVDEVAKQLQIETSAIGVEFKALLQNKLRPAIETLLGHANESGIDHRKYLRDAVLQLEIDLARLKDDFDLDAPLPGEEPDWLNMTEEDIAAMNADVQKQWEASRSN